MADRKLMEVEMVRGISIIGVVIIHVTANGTVLFPLFSASQVLYALMNNWGHFSVPAFIFLSGIVLTRRYAASWDSSCVAPFIKKRIWRLGIAYLLVSFLYVCLNSRLYLVPLPDTISSVMRIIFLGEASYHLYFIPLILQYSIFFVLLMSMDDKTGNGKQLMLTAFLMQALSNIMMLWLFPGFDRSLFFLTYIPFFVAGYLVGKDYGKFSFAVSGTYRLFVVLLLSFSLNLTYSYLYSGSKSMLVTFLRDYVRYVYCFASIFFFMSFLIFVQKNKALRKGLQVLGQFSFSIYLLHPAVLSILEKAVVVSHTSSFYHFYTVGRLILGLAIPILIMICIEKMGLKKCSRKPS